MRLYAKFFLCAAVVISAALLLSGYLLITFSHEGAIGREKERAINQFRFDSFAVLAGLISGAYYGEALYDTLGRVSAGLSGEAMFFSEAGSLIWGRNGDILLPESTGGNLRVVRIQTVGGVSYITVSGRIAQGGINLYMLIATDISEIIETNEQMRQNFLQIYFVTLTISMAGVLVLAIFIAGSVKRISKASARIAGGNYGERLYFSGGDEIGELAGNFNLMADAIEEKICELSENARQKEDFVANFAHELKTPLTSVIGYADMIYRKPLTVENTKEAALYILNEGLRLESLSLKLMELIVLNRQDFVMEEVSTLDIFEDIAGSLKPVLEEKRVEISRSIQPGYVRVEYDLFKTLMFNLIDNAVKAGCGKIGISGKAVGGVYEINVTDNGTGMPASEISKITEAFYTVDKSRSRKQHGAGIGLALAERIAALHGGTLVFSSSEGIGTRVKIDLQRGDGYE